MIEGLQNNIGHVYLRIFIYHIFIYMYHLYISSYMYQKNALWHPHHFSVCHRLYIEVKSEIKTMYTNLGTLYVVWHLRNIPISHFFFTVCQKLPASGKCPKVRKILKSARKCRKCPDVPEFDIFKRKFFRDTLSLKAK